MIACSTYQRQPFMLKSLVATWACSGHRAIYLLSVQGSRYIHCMFQHIKITLYVQDIIGPVIVLSNSKLHLFLNTIIVHIINQSQSIITQHCYKQSSNSAFYVLMLDVQAIRSHTRFTLNCHIRLQQPTFPSTQVGCLPTMLHNRYFLDCFHKYSQTKSSFPSWSTLLNILSSHANTLESLSVHRVLFSYDALTIRLV